MVTVNDENMRPASSPNENERARFGFIKRPSQVDVFSRRPSHEKLHTWTSASSKPSQLGHSQQVVEEAVKTVSLLPLVAEIMGDPQASVPLLTAKLVADRYDCRSRMTELADHNRALKQALAEKKDQHRALILALTPIEADINCQVRAAASLTQQFMPIITGAVRMAFQESAADAIACTPTRGQTSTEEAALDVLRRCCEAEAKRADDAEASLQSMRQELAQAIEAKAAYRQAAKEVSVQAKQQVDEAAKLLHHQISEATNDRELLVQAAQEREAELLAELAKAVMPSSKAIMQQEAMPQMAG